LTFLLKIVTKSQQCLTQPSDEAYCLWCSFINMQDRIQIPIACAALHYIRQCTKGKEFLKHIESVQDKHIALVKWKVPEMDCGVSAIIGVTADQIIQERLKVRHAQADHSGYPIMSRLAKALNDPQKL
jgi:hypothetical protein